MKNLKPTVPSKKYLMLITPLLRKATSILSQLRMGHVPLAKHLHHIGKANSLTCPACTQNKESIQHYILHCPAYHQARQQLYKNTGGRDINIKKLFSRLKTMQVLFQFITATQHFLSTHGDIPALRDKREERRR